MKNSGLRLLPFLSGLSMSINFLVFWAVPIMGMGGLYKSVFKPFLKPIYDEIDTNKTLRWFATTYIYTKPEFADFVAMSLLLVVNCSISIPIMFYWQLTYGSLPWWLIFAYYCSWVGIGGTMMGSAYGLAHKEGHYRGMYKKWFKDYLGNVFENGLGVFFGNTPYNFTTSHVAIHHKLDGGIGDTFYEWDFDRSSLAYFMLYVHRVFLHMVGYSSIKFFNAQDVKAKAELLQKGVYMYWGTAAAILLLTRSVSFLFWMYIQPLFCMAYFLALINIGFHGFIEYDEHGEHIPCVNSCTIVEGEDDFFGEDDHMAHHYNIGVFYRDLVAHQKTQVETFKKYKASVFKKLSIVELSIFILLGLWDKLADHYVDYTGAMTREEIKELLRVRAQRLETNYARYEEYLRDPTTEARKVFAEEIHNNVLKHLKMVTGGISRSGTESPSSVASKKDD